MNTKLSKAAMSDLGQIRSLYERRLDSNEEYANILQWKKGVYPKDADWKNYIENGEMYLLTVDDALAGAVVLTKSQSAEYHDVHWQIDAQDTDVSVIHLLAIDPAYQGKGLATVILDAAMKIAADTKKRAVRLDAIGTNEPAQKLYERYGFVKCGTARLFYDSCGWQDFVFYEYPVNSEKTPSMSAQRGV